jgi:hypothetical protein
MHSILPADVSLQMLLVPRMCFVSAPVRQVERVPAAEPHVHHCSAQMGYQLPVAEERLAACRYPIVRGSATLMLAKSLKQQRQQSPQPVAAAQSQQRQQSPQPSVPVAAEHVQQQQESGPQEEQEPDSVQPQQASAEAQQPLDLHQVQEPPPQQAPAMDATGGLNGDLTLTDLIQCSLPQQKKAQQPSRARGGPGSRKRPPPLLPPAPPLPAQRHQPLQQGQQHDQQHQAAQPSEQQAALCPADAKRLKGELEQPLQPTAPDEPPPGLPGAACCAAHPCQHGRQAVMLLRV